MKKYLLGLIFVLAVSVAFAGDGPFPGRGLVGEYQAPQGTITLTEGHRTPDSVEIIAVLTNSSGQVVATGRAYHPMMSSTLSIPLRFISGAPGFFIAHAITSDASNKSSVNNLRLNVTVLINGGSPEDLVFNRVSKN